MSAYFGVRHPRSKLDVARTLALSIRSPRSEASIDLPRACPSLAEFVGLIFSKQLDGSEMRVLAIL